MAQSNKPNKAFILAAGYGKRMRPYTDQYPKPMVKVAGRSLIYRILDRLAEAQVRDVVINMHYKADVLQQHLDLYCNNEPLGSQLKLHYSVEEEVLDTGGGIKNVLHYFDDSPFFVIAGDAFWTDGSEQTALQRLVHHWDDKTMDIMTLMQPLERMTLTKGTGDYDLLEGGNVRRSLDQTGAYMWTNIRLNTKHIYESAPEGSFSFLKLMDEAENNKRFYSLVHDADWHHISTPEDLENVNKALLDKGESPGEKKQA